MVVYYSSDSQFSKNEIELTPYIALIVCLSHGVHGQRFFPPEFEFRFITTNKKNLL